MENTPKSSTTTRHFRSRSYTPGAAERKGRRSSLPKAGNVTHERKISEFSKILCEIKLFPEVYDTLINEA